MSGMRVERCANRKLTCDFPVPLITIFCCIFAILVGMAMERLGRPVVRLIVGRVMGVWVENRCVDPT